MSTSTTTDLIITAALPRPDDTSILVLVAASGGNGSPSSGSGSEPPAASERPRLVTDGLDLGGIDAAALQQLLAGLDFTGELDSVIRVPAAVAGAAGAASVLVVGVGHELEHAEEDPDAALLGGSAAAVLARAAGRAVRELAGQRSAVLLVPAPDARALEALAAGALSAAYGWSRRVPALTAPLASVTIVSELAEDDRDAAAVHARAIATGTALVRDLVNDPPNALTPQRFVERAQEALEGSGVAIEVLDEAALAEQGFGGIVGVGQGSVHPPRLVRLGWAPEGAQRTVALIGKGITFDSGGLSLKPPASMPEMKSDMAGAATVLGTVLAVASLGLPVAVTGWLALAENMPGADAQRPSDIVTMRGGTTVEITNTDAEGRLVMADALARAIEEEPDAVLDIATLTGAQIVALGERVAGVMGTAPLRDAVVEAARVAGEAFWPMPLPAHLRSNLDTPFATIRNAAVGDRAGGMLVAGLFLKEFVGSVPWAHLDVAGPAYNEHGPWGGTPTGGTGSGLTTLVELVRSMS